MNTTLSPKCLALVRTFLSALMAGIMIGVGGTIYLSSSVPALGAFLFCVGLFTICTFGLRLYTGRVGHVLDNREFADLIATWLGNLAGTFLCGVAVAAAKPNLREAALNACLNNRLTQSFLTTLILSILCGILMYIAVDSYRMGKDGFAKYLGMLLCVPTFILCGCEHSVADMFYFALAGKLPAGFLFILTATLGNAIGAIGMNYIIQFIAPKP